MIASKKKIYTLTEKEVGKDKQGHVLVEKTEKWEERLDDGPAKTVKSHTDQYSK